MADLAELLLEAGLIQFGAFEEDGGMAPYQLHLELLPSYPDILELVVAQVAGRLGAVDHLLCTADAVPIGVALGLQVSLPLVYSRGSDAPAVSDLVGAYDIGHKAALIVTSLSDVARTQRLIDGARRVGLDTQQIIAVVDTGARVEDTPYIALLTMAALVDDLTACHLLPEGQARAVHDWMSG
jgi:hypothetical protein